ncbi:MULTISPECIES: hypothetical protein [unclassified Mycobacterium]|uniref:hypothetical protein n=1 Tax=unclassified Mycobacterium TaxID=2642494 RepID=UPI0029C8DF5B|nr:MULTISPECIES: hypothetical protein [unclassified Mycobacterium]
MTVPSLPQCTGLWRRTLLIGADGSHDTSADVRWLQSISGYVDSRGFAGTLHQRDDVFAWHRDVDLEPPGPFPDAGAMRWDGDVLIETGVHEHYVEHWVRDEGPRTPSGAVFLSAPDGAAGLLVRVGDLFGWAGAGTVLIDTVGGPRWNALAIEVSDDHVQANGVHWNIERSEGNVNP